jgi:hypothetical protein
MTAHRLDRLVDGLGHGEVLLCLGDPLDQLAVGLGERDVRACGKITRSFL